MIFRCSFHNKVEYRENVYKNRVLLFSTLFYYSIPAFFSFILQYYCNRIEKHFLNFKVFLGFIWVSGKKKKNAFFYVIVQITLWSDPVTFNIRYSNILKNTYYHYNQYVILLNRLGEGCELFYYKPTSF